MVNESSAFQNNEKVTFVIVAAIVLSVAIHGILWFCVANRYFSTLDIAKADDGLKASTEVPVMLADMLVEDPFSKPSKPVEEKLPEVNERKDLQKELLDTAVSKDAPDLSGDVAPVSPQAAALKENLENYSDEFDGTRKLLDAPSAASEQVKAAVDVKPQQGALRYVPGDEILSQLNAAPSPDPKSLNVDSDKLYIPSAGSLDDILSDDRIGVSGSVAGPRGGGRAGGRVSVKVPDAVQPVVNEALVADEKRAVEDLKNADEGEPFADHVTAQLESRVDVLNPQWKYFKLTLSNSRLNPFAPIPKDFVFMIDVSGSIAQQRLESVKRATDDLIDAMPAYDRFNIIAFSNKCEYAFSEWRTASVDAKAQAKKWLAEIKSGGQTDVFGTLRNSLTMPRRPERPVVALVASDGEPTSGMTDSAAIISSFANLNDGLLSLYMYGVKESANAFLMDMLAHGSRGGWMRHRKRMMHESDMRSAAEEMLPFASSLKDPVLTDISIAFTGGNQIEAYPQLTENLYAGRSIVIWGRCNTGRRELVFNVKGLRGSKVMEQLFKVPFDNLKELDASARKEWATHKLYDLFAEQSRKRTLERELEMKELCKNYGIDFAYGRNDEKQEELK